MQPNMETITVTLLRNDKDVSHSHKVIMFQKQLQMLSQQATAHQAMKLSQRTSLNCTYTLRQKAIPMRVD